jgi:hypothetical protein
LAVAGTIVRLITELLRRRQLRWVEISLARAWSRDMPPRLFDLGDG